MSSHTLRNQSCMSGVKVHACNTRIYLLGRKEKVCKFRDSLAAQQDCVSRGTCARQRDKGRRRRESEKGG